MDNSSLTLNLSRLKNSCFLFAYFSMILFGLMMPSDGNHGIMTPKSLSFIGSALFFLILVLTKKNLSRSQLKTFVFTGFLGLFLFVWAFLGLLDDPSNTAASFDQFKIFMITIFFVVMTLYAVDEGLVTPQTIIKGMIFVNFAYSCMKLLLVLLHLLNLINMFELLELMNLRFMSMDMTSGLSRLQTSVDIVTPFFIFFALQSDALNLQFSSRFKYVYCFISIISILFSFSRFLMAVALCSALLYWFTLNKKSILKAFSICIILSLCLIAAIGFDAFFLIVERRFFSNDNYYSDLTRTDQINALVEQFFTSPYLGMGLGGYVKDFIRDGGIVYSYEVQWAAFLMQFGLIGLPLLILPLLFICSRFLIRPITRVKLSFLALFFIWLLSGFTNPFLISLASGIIYSIFLLAAQILNTKEKHESIK